MCIECVDMLTTHTLFKPSRFRRANQIGRNAVKVYEDNILADLSMSQLDQGCSPMRKPMLPENSQRIGMGWDPGTAHINSLETRDFSKTLQIPLAKLGRGARKIESNSVAKLRLVFSCNWRKVLDKAVCPCKR